MGSSPGRQMHINVGLGHHEAAWRLPSSRPRQVVDLEYYRHIAAVAEQGRLDSIFLADIVASGPDLRRNLTHALEPIGILSALAAVTSRVGLIGTASTTFQDPFNLARRFATLDHLSGGRAGWNIVTSASDAEARNFGLAGIPDHADRYRRAAEFVEVTNELWDSWEDGALLGDKRSGVFVDTERVHAIDHDGEFFKVAGPLGVPRSPQGRPVLVQAGSSRDGIDLAAKVGEAIFTAQRTLADGKAFYADLKSRAERHGRDPERIVILPGIVPVIGSTEEEAERLEQELQDLIQYEFSLEQLSRFLDHEITIDQLDEPLPHIPVGDDIEKHQSRSALIAEMARSNGLTVRQVVARMAGGRGHRTSRGTPEQVADDLELWFRSGAADGFNYLPPSVPGQLEAFVDTVIPILQERGLFRREYAGSTLREHYDLERPVSQYAGAAPVLAS